MQQSRRLFTSEVENMEVDEEEKAEAEIKQKKKEKRDKEKASKPQKSSLLSFGDEGILFIWSGDSTMIQLLLPDVLI